MESIMLRQVELIIAESSPIMYGAPVGGPEDVARQFRKAFGHAVKESFWCVALDGRTQPIGWHLVSTGTATAALVHPREVFGPLLMQGAVACIVMHNHPSGCATPSPEDRDITQRLKRAGDLLGVTLLDHVIVCRRDTYSFKAHGDL